MPFTREEIAEIIGTLDAISEMTHDRLALQTASNPVAKALDDAAFQTALARNAFLSAAEHAPPLSLQEAQ